MNALPCAQPAGTRLAGRLVAVSVSEAADLAQLGFPQDQMDLALLALLVPLVADGACIAYGGRIEHPHNFTLVISEQLGEAYRRLEQTLGRRPFVHFVAQHRLLATEPEQLLAHLKQLAPYGEIWVTSPEGIVSSLAAAGKGQAEFAACEGRGLDGGGAMEIFRDTAGLLATRAYRSIQSLTSVDASSSFTHMRGHMAAHCDARVQVGGRKTGFSGPISGLCEEALLTIASRKPLLVLGGFGGASRDIAAALGFFDTSECVPPKVAPDLERYEAGLQRLREARPDFEALFAVNQMAAVQALAGTESLTDAAEQLHALLGSCLDASLLS